MKRLLALILTIGLFTFAAFAHNGEHHMIGTVVSVDSSSITVKMMDGTTHKAVLNDKTKYLRGTDAIAVSDIKAGDKVVIHATEANEVMTATEVKVGAMNMKGMKGHMSGMKMDEDSKANPQ